MALLWVLGTFAIVGLCIAQNVEKTVFEFSRASQTCDEQDRAIDDGTQRVSGQRDNINLFISAQFAQWLCFALPINFPELLPSTRTTCTQLFATLIIFIVFALGEFGFSLFKSLFKD